MKKILGVFVVTIFLVIPLIITIFLAINLRDVAPDSMDGIEEPLGKVETIDGDLKGIKNNRFRLSESGLYELYVEGAPYERGVYAGKLTSELIRSQESIFVDMIKKLVPSDIYRFFLKSVIYFFNRKTASNIPGENIQEIWGISRSASSDFDFIGSGYMRILNYHAAHDIGHLLQNLNLVACTAFASWGEKTQDGDLITGRNFDFYLGEKFAKDKIVEFVNPKDGIPFAMIVWGGMTGVVSGMNKSGLSVVINAAESEIPEESATPVTLVAREILQYADDIASALKIANSREIFVSQNFLISSAKDARSVVIEKRPGETAAFEGEGEKNYISVTNHFQGKLKTSYLESGSKLAEFSLGRLKRVNELIEGPEKMSVNRIVDILRDRKKLGGEDVKPGSEFAINQFLAHHSIVFNNTKKVMYVSTSPWQLGKFVAYDLEKIFKSFPEMVKDAEIYDVERMIPSDDFMDTEEFKKIMKSRNDGTFKSDDIRFSKDGLNA